MTVKELLQYVNSMSTLITVYDSEKNHILYAKAEDIINGIAKKKVKKVLESKIISFDVDAYDGLVIYLCG